MAESVDGKEKLRLIQKPLLFWLGLLIFVILLAAPTPDGMNERAKRVGAVTFLTAFWWITEALPIPATSLLPLLLFPLLNIMKSGEVSRAYVDKIIFLFIGGFFIAVTIERWNLHKRFALNIIKRVGRKPRGMIFGFMAATAILSMGISNTATTLMMLPIALAVADEMKAGLGKAGLGKAGENLTVALLLGIAYSASVGGIGTLIGTPPNLIFAAQLKKNFPHAPEISFLDWMLLGVPLVIVFVPVIWFVLTRIVSPVRSDLKLERGEVIEREIRKLGPMSLGEKYTLVCFALTAFLWIFRKDIVLGPVRIPGWSNLLGIQDYVHDSTVAIGMALVMFAIPVDRKKNEYLLDWESAVGIPWGMILLFGGGLAIAHGFKASGLSLWIGSRLEILGGAPPLLLIFAIALLLTFLTEFTSNTAATSVMMPILAAMAVHTKIHPLLLMIPATVSASCAFMLPVATPPNAIIFGTKRVRIPTMVKCGLLLNFLGAIMVTALVYLLGIPLFGISLTELPAWVK
jgi:sodium-dependent dicarboxylate transporter 2/3/5